MSTSLYRPRSHILIGLFRLTQQPPTKVGGLVINGLKVRIRIG
ncbi:protein of unknown function [Xenorhabdus poinarii G6]|uniref:Uncharacterized protein n=1 Tax=Xenorhabdus poinarii G6 TaxID=1354304 RepID=A0A068R880_9GAMM|nr:protein of unknown function [Xenorhabdus poinarii G6]